MSALVTGASGGLGAAIALSLAQGGHDVAIHYRGDESGARATADRVERTGRTAALLHADLTTDLDSAGAERLDALADHLLAETAAALGPVQAVVLNAFPQDLTPWDTLQSTTWDAMYAAGLRPSAALLHAAGRHFTEHSTPGVVVLVGSIEGLRPAPDHTAYATTKAALHQLVAAGAAALGPSDIRVVGVAPGLLDREGLREAWPDGVRRWQSTVPLQRLVRAEEVAAVVTFLASASASGLTGITVPVDAGWTAAPGW